jgi:hypothetical protein
MKRGPAKVTFLFSSGLKLLDDHCPLVKLLQMDAEQSISVLASFSASGSRVAKSAPISGSYELDYSTILW